MGRGLRAQRAGGRVGPARILVGLVVPDPAPGATDGQRSGLDDLLAARTGDRLVTSGEGDHLSQRLGAVVEGRRGSDADLVTVNPTGGYRTVTVAVSWTDGDGNTQTLSISTVITDYVPT